MRWAAVLDLFGNYLATAVLAYVLWRHLQPRNPLIADLPTLAALRYALAGGVSAAILAMVAPMLMHNYTDTTAAGQALIAVQFATVLEVVALHLAIPRCHHPGGLVARNRVVLPPRSSSLVPSVTGRSRSSRGRRQRRRTNFTRDVLLGVLLVLWTAWWISLMVVFARQTQTSPHHLPRHDAASALLAAVPAHIRWL